MGDGSPDDGRAENPESLDTALEALSQYQRREIIRYLRDSPGNVQHLDGLVDHLVGIERQQSGPVPGEDHVLAVLVHVHAPKLDTLGIISYDLTTGDVRYHPNERVERLLDQIDQIADEW